MRVLLIVTSHNQMGDTGQLTGLWLEELAAPYFEFTRQGCEVDIASVQGGSAPLDPRSLTELPAAAAEFLADPVAMAKVHATLRLSAIREAGGQYEAYYVVGGHGIMWDAPDDKDLQAMLADAFENGKAVAAVCHGSAALVNIRLRDGEALVKGRHLTCFTDEEEERVKGEHVVPFLLESRLKERGAVIEKALPFEECVVQDGLLVTGQNPASAGGVARRVLSLVAPAIALPG